MNKKVIEIRLLTLMLIIAIITLGIIYFIDMNRIKNNMPVLFSTWGYDYAPPEVIYPNGNNNSKSETEEYFYAKVIESGSNYIIIEPNEGEVVRNSSDKISIGLGEYNDRTYLVGTMVKITYPGYIMESYPAQVHASKIELVSKIELMYMAIIDDIMKQDNGLNNEAKYISLDIDSLAAPLERGKGSLHSKFLGLEESEKETLLRYCKKYHSDIKDYSFKELNENGLFDRENMRIEGILISVDEIEKLTEDSAIMTVRKYRSGLGAIFPKYKLTYENGKWDIKVISMAIS